MLLGKSRKKVAIELLNNTATINRIHKGSRRSVH